MTISVSSNEARNRLGKLLRLAAEKNEVVVIRVRGEATAVLVSYADFEEFTRLKKAQRASEALEKIRAVRDRVQTQTADLSEREAYQLAGFGGQATEDIIQHDRILNGEE
ncbi:MAG: type II toxin-antitoxin system Phd/YefM family antitoxin [Chloroflexi bacterium]|nr:MAG: type II toxin-antitoxin system Phd/YefM family antitoxin [Chloroflexota bacterium]